MRRQYTVDEFRGMVNKIKSQIADFNFTTDIMVGFPGETEEDFQETCKLIKEIGFTPCPYIQIFSAAGNPC